MDKENKKKHKVCRNALQVVGRQGIDYWTNRNGGFTPEELLSETPLEIDVVKKKDRLGSVLHQGKRGMQEALIPIAPPARHIEGVFIDVAYDFTKPDIEHYGIQLYVYFVMGSGTSNLYTWRVEPPHEGAHNYWHVQLNADPEGSRRMDTETGDRVPSSYPAFPLNARCAFEALTCSLVAIIGLKDSLIEDLRRAERDANAPGTLHQSFLEPEP